MIQFYEPEVLGTEYVIRGNTALLKCTIPSFVADFVDVDAWLSDSGDIYRSFTENLHGNIGAAELGSISTNPPFLPPITCSGISAFRSGSGQRIRHAGQ